MNEAQDQVPELNIIYDLEYEVLKADVVKTALELDLFTTIGDGHRTLDDLVETTGYDRRGLRILLDALCPLGLLSKSRSAYSLTSVSATYLVRDRRTFYGDWTLRTQIAWHARARSAEAVKTGIAVGGDYSRSDKDGEWVTNYSPTLINWPQRAEKARAMWNRLCVSRKEYPALRILDAACGHGIKTFVLAQDDRDARVTAVDSPQMLELSTAIADLMGVRDQVEFLPGDVSVMEWGENQYDIVHFGLILYYFSGKRLNSILRRAHAALKTGGLLVIHEYLADEERCDDETALLVAYQLLLFAPDSEVRTFSEYEQILRNVGFTDVTLHNEGLVTARKD